MPRDPVMQGFLKRQVEDAAKLTSASSLVSITPVDAAGTDELPSHYLLQFHCKGLIRRASGEIAVAERFRIALYFPPYYLRKASAFESLAFLEPREIFHPNINGPFICVGEALMRRSPGIVEIAHQLFAIISWQKYSARDALSPAAAAWARRHQDQFPIDRRPLKGRKLAVELVSGGAA